MILFVFNQIFPANTGFSNRVSNAIMAMHDEDKTVVLCRTGGNRLSTPEYNIAHFDAETKLMERTDSTYKQGWYELKRNIDICRGLTYTLWKIWKSNKGKKIRIYAIASPLTVPFIVYLLSFFLRYECTLLEIHDLEPEVAMHIKGLDEKNFIVKIEFFLEKFLVKAFKKVIVTSQSQANVIVKRTGISISKIAVIPNTVHAQDARQEADYRNKLDIQTDDFVLAYSSALSYGYTTDGLIELLEKLSTKIHNMPKLRFVIAGDGDGLLLIKDSIEKHNLTNQVILLGRVNNVQQLLVESNAAIIPWKKDIMTETILPTKLFEYMSAGLAIVAPDFGEFSYNLVDKDNALLYSSFDQAVEQIRYLYNNRIEASDMGNRAKKLFETTFKNGDYTEDIRNFWNKT